MLRTANLIHPASTQTSRYTLGISLPGTLASPRTELTSASCRELLARLRHIHSFVSITPELLDAPGSPFANWQGWFVEAIAGSTLVKTPDCVSYHLALMLEDIGWFVHEIALARLAAWIMFPISLS